MKRLPAILVAVLALAYSGCPRRNQVNPGPPPVDAEQALEQARAELEARHYRQAQEQLTFLIFNYPGSSQASDAQYYLAESYFQSGDHTQAQTEFDFYLKSFSNGRFQEQATYKLALSYLRSAPGYSRDQSRALQAKDMIEEFLAAYPGSPLLPAAESVRAEVEQRLARKEFDAARLYFKSGEYPSSLVYYEYVLSEHSHALWAAQDRLQLGICYAELGRASDARLVFDEILAGSYPEETKEQARVRLARLN